MSINSKLSRLSIDLHNVNQSSSLPTASKSKASRQKSTEPVAESWEDESISDHEPQSPASDASTPVEAPGPDLKSPTTRAIDAEKDLTGDEAENMMIPPPTPVSPLSSSSKTDWSTAAAMGGGRPTFTSASNYSNSNPSSSARSTPTRSMTPQQRYPTPNPPVDSTLRDRDRDRDRDSDRERKRPEKTTATANRLIAGALGLKAPPKTEEQKRYDRAVKEQEIKRRNKEKEERKKAEEEDERAKAAVWDS